MKLQKRRRPSHVSLAQAERLLPRVRSIVVELQLLQQAIDLVDSLEIEFEDDDAFSDGMDSYGNVDGYDAVDGYDEMELNTKLNKEFHRLSYLYYKKLEQLEQYGCILKDLEEGLVDFPHRFQGRKVFLCWKLGEDKVQFWHGADDGYTGRQKIVRDETLCEERLK